MPADALIKRRREEQRLKNIASQKSFLAKQGISVREGAVLDPKSADFDYEEYQKSQAIESFVAAKPFNPTRRQSSPLQYEKLKERSLMEQYNKILATKKKFAVSGERLEEARGAGSDPRTVQAYVDESNRLTGEYERIQARARKSRGAVGQSYGKRVETIRETGRDLYSGEYFGGENVGMLGTNLSLLQADLEGRAQSEAKIQGSLGEVRQRRKSFIERAQEQLSGRGGRSALLSSQAGGSGFLQGYFK